MFRRRGAKGEGGKGERGADGEGEDGREGEAHTLAEKLKWKKGSTLYTRMAEVLRCCLHDRLHRHTAACKRPRCRSQTRLYEVHEFELQVHGLTLFSFGISRL